MHVHLFDLHSLKSASSHSFSLGLTICGANCLLSADYKSPSKIIARTGQSKPGKGEVIVSTKSGGVGSCTVQFKSLPVIPGKKSVLQT